jgi:crotonobetainyl-CoA:carnitine CoA-transferase CaiB-like acyl-CoA transferase
LAGIKILDLTAVVLGPFATGILASLGAQVIKVESPDGDTMRHVGPMKNKEMGHIFLHANAGKQSVVLDFESVKQPSPRIIYVNCCGFDQSGPYAAKPAYDDLIQGAVGAL